MLVAAACTRTVHGSGHRLIPPSATPSTPDFPSGATTPPPSSSAPPTTTPPPTTPTRPQLEARLAARTPGQRLVLVAIPGGYEAISYDQSTHVAFWKYADANWTRVGASSYPYSSAIGAPANARAIGRLLSGMQDATFIVTGTFTVDGSGNAVAYTTGPRGWGAIKAEPNGNIGPSGEPIGADKLGLSFGFAFVGGLLQTMDCRQDQPIAACAGNPIVKLWRWTGTDFARV